MWEESQIVQKRTARRLAGFGGNSTCGMGFFFISAGSAAFGGFLGFFHSCGLGEEKNVPKIIQNPTARTLAGL